MAESLFSPAAALPRSDSPDAPVTDFAVFESQKENIRPLASGRSAAALSAVFVKESTATVDKGLEVEHERFRKDIEEAERRDKEGEEMVDGVQDVLDVYNKYIAWTIQHYPSSDHHILPLVESTCRRFVGDPRYTQDIRYLKLWVTYTRQVERRENVWAFLEARDIGTRHAVFYEEWAGAAEFLGRCVYFPSSPSPEKANGAEGRKKKADEIYLLGIRRRAVPLERIKTRHQAFLARIMAVSGQIPDEDPALPPLAPLRTPGRAVLGQVGTVSGATQLAPSQRLAKGNNGAKMEIFADGQGAPADDGAGGEWADFGTRDSRRKENTVEATAWKGETLPQSAARNRVAPRTPKIEVFRETTDEVNGALRPAEEVFSRAKSTLTAAEMLKADPLRNFDAKVPASTTVASLPAPPSTRKPPRPAKASASFIKPTWECPNDGPRVKSSSGKTELRKFDWDAVFKNGSEWSFEEIRAKARGLHGKEWKGDVKPWELGWHSAGSSTPKAVEKKARMPSPTVNTKLANDDIMEMFNQTLHNGRKARRSVDSDDDSDEESDDEDVPVITAPTPIPSRAQAVSMLAPTNGMVPPTPTPAGAFSAKPSPMIFQDENAVPPSASKKLNVFSETPAKTPLAARTPLGASSSTSKAFEIFQEEPAGVENTPSVKPRAVPNIFATPAVGEKQASRKHVVTSIAEEPEDGEEDDEVVLQRVIEEAQSAEAQGYDLGEDDAPRRQGRFQIHEMTPITERTCEFTSYGTTLRSSTRTSKRFSTSTDLEEGDEDEEAGNEAVQLTEPIHTADLGSAEDTRARTQARQSGSTSPTALFPPSHSVVAGSADGSFDRSGSPTTPFVLPDGYTIHQTGGSSMMLVDRTSTMHIARADSAEPDENVASTVAESVKPAHGAEGPLSNPCNPSDDDVIAALLSQISPPLSELSAFHDYRDTTFNRLDALQKHAKSRTRRGSTASRASNAGGEDFVILDLASRKYEVWDKIGEGGYGAVFLAVDVAARAEQDAKDDDDDEDEDEDDECFVAVKVEKPSSVWETVILDRIYSRLAAPILESIIKRRDLFAFQDESYLLLDFSPQGTLLDLVNKATSLSIAPSTSGGISSVDELIAVFFIIELLRVVESLHSSGFIHGDLKIDNCLVRLEPVSGGASAWNAQYTRSGKDGWNKKGLRLIDFGRGIDMSLYPAGEKQRFTADWKVDERDCVEMREGREWSWETDYFGLAGVAYCMLFGKYITTEEAGGKQRIATPLKRYWQADIWTRLFDALLNPHSVNPDGALPITNELTSIRGQFEDWLEENCQKGGKNLRSMLKKVETAAILSKRV